MKPERVEVNGVEVPNPVSVKFDLKPGLYRNNWPTDYVPPILLDWSVLAEGIQNVGFSFVVAMQRITEMVSEVEKMYPWASGRFYPLIEHPIRDKSKGGWIAWCDGKWRKCERVQGGWQWSE